MSWPAEKCLPLDLKTMTFTAGAKFACFQARSSSSRTLRLCALAASGRLSVITAMLSTTSYRTCSSSMLGACLDVHQSAERATHDLLHICWARAGREVLDVRARLGQAL